MKDKQNLPQIFSFAINGSTFYIRNSSVMTNDNFRAMHDAIIAGDPKLRSLRALYTTVYKQYADFSRETSPQKGGEKT